MKALILTGLAAALILPASANAAGDPVAGKKTFGQCAACHSVQPNGPDGVGPNLAGVFGSKAGIRRKKFAYSPQLKGSKLTWDEPTLDLWIKSPTTLVKGTHMEFIGIPRKPARDNLIAYLKTLK